jgi:nucleotide-binding universal stress UspA family protein
MTTDFESHPPVVVGVDGSPHAALALDWAADEASRRGAPLLVIEAFSPDFPAVRSAGPGEPPTPQPSSALRTAAEAGCAAAAARAREAHADLDVTAMAVAGDPGTVLVEASTTALLVVLGARGLGTIRGLLMGSVSAYVTPRSHCPVVVLREKASHSLDGLRVVVGLAGDVSSAAALRFGFEFAAAHDLGLTVVHTWDLDFDDTAAAVAVSVDWQQADEQERTVVAEVLAGYAGEFPTVDVRRDVVRGHPVAELVRQSENAALLVLGTRGRRGVKSLVLGSVTHGVLHGAHCPVAVVPTSEDPTAHRELHPPKRQFHLPVPPVREHL